MPAIDRAGVEWKGEMARRGRHGLRQDICECIYMGLRESLLWGQYQPPSPLKQAAIGMYQGGICSKHEDRRMRSEDLGRQLYFVSCVLIAVVCLRQKIEKKGWKSQTAGVTCNEYSLKNIANQPQNIGHKSLFWHWKISPEEPLSAASPLFERGDI